MKKTTLYPMFSPRRYTACWQCVEACPRKAIKKMKFLWHRHAMPTYQDCIGCNICVNTCPKGCFTVRKIRNNKL